MTLNFSKPALSLRLRRENYRIPHLGILKSIGCNSEMKVIFNEEN